MEDAILHGAIPVIIMDGVQVRPLVKGIVGGYVQFVFFFVPCSVPVTE